MRFYKRNIDAMSFRSGSIAGGNAQGSAAVAGGSLNTGSAASDVLSELNTVKTSVEGQTELTVAGDPSQWNQLLRLRQATPPANSSSPSEVISKGTLDENLKTILLQNPSLIETISKANSVDPSQPIVKSQFTDAYDELSTQLEAKTTRGSHIVSTSTTKSIKGLAPSPVNATSIDAWHEDLQTKASTKFTGYRSHSQQISGAQTDTTRVTSLGLVGTTNNRADFSIVGFSSNANPNDGKSSSIAVFATNNRTVGTIRVPQLISGIKPTLQSIADQYGTTVEQLVKVNNLPSADTDISGLNLTVPADLLTVDYYTVATPAAGEPASTPRSLAKQFGVNVSWLLDLNGWTDPGITLQPGSKVQVPGLTKSCDAQPGLTGCRTTALAPAKPLATELETADYGAYTTTNVTYDCAGSLMAYCSRFLKPRR